jgi:hypothetical protein
MTSKCFFFVPQDYGAISYAVPLFSHLEGAKVIDANLRERTLGHIQLAFYHHGIENINGLTLEQTIFDKVSFILGLRSFRLMCPTTG